MDNITRRHFLDRARTYTIGGLAGATALESLATAPALAQQTATGGGTLQDWLGLTEEAALEPDLPIIDPHHHLWDRPDSRYLLDELVADARAHRIEKTVFVEFGAMYRAEGDTAQAHRPVGELVFVVEGRRFRERFDDGIQECIDKRVTRMVRLDQVVLRIDCALGFLCE